MNEYSKEQKEKIIKAFLTSLESGVNITDACKTAGVSRCTIWKWRNSDIEFDEYINTVLDSRTQSVEDALFTNATGGNVVAQIFWLKNRSQGRWRDKQEIEHSGEIDLNKEEMNEFIDIAKGAIERLENNSNGNKGRN